MNVSFHLDFDVRDLAQLAELVVARDLPRLEAISEAIRFRPTAEQAVWFCKAINADRDGEDREEMIEALYAGKASGMRKPWFSHTAPYGYTIQHMVAELSRHYPTRLVA
jgi:hypothetical protein